MQELNRLKFSVLKMLLTNCEIEQEPHIVRIIGEVDALQALEKRLPSLREFFLCDHIELWTEDYPVSLPASKQHQLRAS